MHSVIKKTALSICAFIAMATAAHAQAPKQPLVTTPVDIDAISPTSHCNLLVYLTKLNAGSPWTAQLILHGENMHIRNNENNPAPEVVFYVPSPDRAVGTRNIQAANNNLCSARTLSDLGDIIASNASSVKMECSTKTFVFYTDDYSSSPQVHTRESSYYTPCN